MRRTGLARADDIVAKPDLVGPAAQRIGIEGERDADIRKARQRGGRLPESLLRPVAQGVVLDRLVAIPFCLWQRPRQGADLRDQSRRRHAASQQREAGALARLLLLEPRLQRRLERAPRLDTSRAVRRFRAVRIVERQHRGFGEHVGCAETSRMARIAVDLDRPAFDRGDDDAAAVTGKRQCGGETQRHARRLALGEFHIGHDLLVGPAAGGERQRCAADQ